VLGARVVHSLVDDGLVVGEVAAQSCHELIAEAVLGGRVAAWLPARVLARRLLFVRVAGVGVVVRCGFLVVLAAFVLLPAALVAAAVAATTGPALVPRVAVGMTVAMGIPLVVGPAVHEAGHALAGVRFGAGIRRLEVDHRGARVRFTVDELPRGRLVVVLLAGPAASLALSAALAPVAVAVGDEILAWAVGLAAAANLVLSTLVQLLPLRVGDRHTDGYQLLGAARGTHPGSPGGE
jgi:hypothetical protein